MKRKQPGEYTFPPNDITNDVYTPSKDLFLNELRKLDEKDDDLRILGDLKNGLVPKVKNMIENNLIEIKEIEWDNLESKEKLKEIKEILTNWRNKYNLYDQNHDNWLMKIIIDQLKVGICYGDKDIIEKIFSPVIHLFDSENYFKNHPDYLNNKENFIIQFEEIWNPLGKTEKEIKKSINKKINDQIQEIKSYMEENNYQRVYPEENKINRFLLFQVKEKTLADIAELEYVGPDTISKSVKKVAESVGIKRRTK